MIDNHELYDLGIPLHLYLDCDGVFKNKKNEDAISIGPDDLHIVRIEKGMASGNSAVAFLIDLPDGKYVFCQTSMKNFLLAADIFKAREAKK